MRAYQPHIRTIAIVVLGVLVLGLGSGVIWQRIVSARLSHQVREQTRDLTEAQKTLKDYAQWQSEYTELSAKLGGRMRECTWSNQMPFMVSQLTGLVEARGLKVQTLRPEPMTSSGSVQRFPMSIEVQAGLGDLARLLRDMGGTYPLLSIERMDIRAVEGNADKLQVRMTVASFMVIDKAAPITKRPELPSAEEKSGDRSEETEPLQSVRSHGGVL